MIALILNVEPNSQYGTFAETLDIFRVRREPLRAINMRFIKVLAGSVCFSVLSGCASAPTPGGAGLTKNGEYALSADESSLDCNRITGRMQVRILQIRDHGVKTRTSQLSRSLQGVVTPLYGGTKRGLDPDGQYARDVARLHAYNKKLAAQGCKTFDLEEELQPKDVSHTPMPR